MAVFGYRGEVGRGREGTGNNVKREEMKEMQGGREARRKGRVGSVVGREGSGGKKGMRGRKEAGRGREEEH